MQLASSDRFCPANVRFLGDNVRLFRLLLSRRGWLPRPCVVRENFASPSGNVGMRWQGCVLVATCECCLSGCGPSESLSVAERVNAPWSLPQVLCVLPDCGSPSANVPVVFSSHSLWRPALVNLVFSFVNVLRKGST